MAESTTIYTPESGSVNSMLPWLMNNRGSWNGSWMDIIPLMFIWGMFGGGWGNGGFGFNGGGNAALANLMNNNDGRELLMQAIQGNRTAISDLAASLNVSTSAIQQGLNAVTLGINQVGNQVGMSGLQVINAIQSGNSDLASKFATCCCENKNLVTSQGYENRLATLQQTDAILAKIGEQTTVINDKFCDLEKREMQGKIDALAQQNTILRSTIDNANQTAAIQGYVAQTVAPLSASLTELSKEVTAIKGSMPNTVSVQYPNLVAMPASTAAGLYVNGGIGGYGYGGNGFFG